MSRDEFSDLVLKAFNRDEIITFKMNNYPHESMFYGTKLQSSFDLIFGSSNSKDNSDKTKEA